MDFYMGTILAWAPNYAPQGWMFCQGQSLGIAQNSALYALLGTMYGGNGTTSFNLPDLRSRVPLGAGQGPGLGNYSQGQQGGSENVTLTTQQMPSHNHAAVAMNQGGNSTNPANNYIAAAYDSANDASFQSFQSSSANQATLNQGTVQANGGSQGHPNIQPYTALNYIICVQGVFPPRS